MAPPRKTWSKPGGRKSGGASSSSASTAACSSRTSRSTRLRAATAPGGKPSSRWRPPPVRPRRPRSSTAPRRGPTASDYGDRRGGRDNRGRGDVAVTITNCDGGVATSPRVVAVPENVQQLQSILRDPDRFPSPVRAMGTFHSLTPCPASTGTVVRMNRMTRILDIDTNDMTMTAEAGLQLGVAAAELRRRGLQFVLNIEIGNATLGSLACCHSKDAMDGVDHGQVSSYVTRIKWVDPNGELAEADEDKDPELLQLARSSYGLCGVVYEVTVRIKPVEIVTF